MIAPAACDCLDPIDQQADRTKQPATQQQGAHQRGTNQDRRDHQRPECDKMIEPGKIAPRLGGFSPFARDDAFGDPFEIAIAGRSMRQASQFEKVAALDVLVTLLGRRQREGIFGRDLILIALE